ncbi:MAG TPA: hypothetical protein ENK91_14765 [Bacteroidetes bacterium]|nr:hypothetical protein [Bacteroidota bacterium]
MKKIMNYVLVVFTTLIATTFTYGQSKLKPTVAVNGLVQYNMEFHNTGDTTFAGSEFRKIVMTTHGKIYKNVGYRVQLDFAQGTAALRDVFLKLGNLPYIGGNLLIGSAIEPTGLDQYTGSVFKTFAERPIMASTQGFRWNSGFFYNNFSLLNNSLSLQLAYTFNGDKDNGFIDKSLNKGGNFMTRITGTVLKNKEKKQLVHLGVRYENRKREDGKYVQGFKPEVHMGDKFVFAVPGIDSQNDYGFELAAKYGPVSIQGEYEISTYSKGDANHSLTGYYGYVSFFPTGESRSYKNSIFGMVVPKKNFCLKDGGFGAIELAIRYSAMDYSNAGSLPKYLGAPIQGDNINGITFGLNWYLNSHTRIIYNYLTSQLQTGHRWNMNLVKFQVKF